MHTPSEGHSASLRASEGLSCQRITALLAESLTDAEAQAEATADSPFAYFYKGRVTAFRLALDLLQEGRA